MLHKYFTRLPSSPQESNCTTCQDVAPASIRLELGLCRVCSRTLRLTPVLRIFLQTLERHRWSDQAGEIGITRMRTAGPQVCAVDIICVSNGTNCTYCQPLNNPITCELFTILEARSLLLRMNYAFTRCGFTDMFHHYCSLWHEFCHVCVKPWPMLQRWARAYLLMSLL